MNLVDKINKIRPSKKTEDFLYVSYYLIFILLILELFILLTLPPFDLRNIPQYPSHIVFINNFSSIIYAPFGRFDSLESIIFALIGYGIFYYGTFIEIADERKELIMNKILDYCRVVFFLAGTLLLLLVIARMGIMIYQDLTIGRSIITIGTSK